MGASSTIGRAIAVDLAELGYAACLWGRDDGRLQEAANACSAVGPPATVARVDVTAHERLAAQVAEIVNRGPLAVVVWAAGLFDGALADEADPGVWARLFEVNLVAAAVLHRAPSTEHRAPSTEHRAPSRSIPRRQVLTARIAGMPTSGRSELPARHGPPRQWLIRRLSGRKPCSTPHSTACVRLVAPILRYTERM